MASRSTGSPGSSRLPWIGSTGRSRPSDRAYVLIRNTDRQAVVGGRREAVARAVAASGGRFHPLPLVSTVHCEVVRPVAGPYHDLHLLPTTPPPGVRYYSGAAGRSFALDRESAAASILAHALGGVDYPRLIRQAYADGIRAFVEVGPGATCTRPIGEILRGEPHLAVSACPGDREPVAALMIALARLVADRFPVDLGAIHDQEGAEPVRSSKAIRVALGGPRFRPPAPPRPVPNPIVAPTLAPARNGHREPALVPPIAPRLAPLPAPLGQAGPAFALASTDPVRDQLVRSEGARAGAHGAFLRASDGIGRAMADHLRFQMDLIGMLAGGDVPPARDFAPIEAPARPPVPPRSLDREACLRFAVGTIGSVLGPDFDAVDAHPTRVRLPDEPLMLVDRILSVEGEPLSMTSGRVVTEHDVHPGAWYLDGGRIPTCIAVESGQADLFLSAYLGIDFETRGLAVYRLLDASVTFHSELPEAGAVIHYDIHIDGFFRQGASRLFRFRFEATVGGQPLMSMRDGCAGFFTADALAAGRGVVRTALDLRPMAGKRPDDWAPLVAMGPESLDDDRVEALRRGDLAGAFGPAFAGLPLDRPCPLPGGLMRLVDRVLAIEPDGGRYGLGLIRAEADIRPDDWFMTCHFVDDRVMPGTLMFECCLHTLRIFLMRMGWIGEDHAIACQPVPGVASRLKCRGQVLPSTARVTYEVTIKELGYRPEPYAIVDALMSADGRAIVEITDMSLRMTGTDLATLRRTWAGRGASTAAPAQAPPLYGPERILAFAVGNPSEAFGEPYRVFDRDRVIARLPGPPYQFLDRVVEVAGEPWKMAAGAKAVAEYDVPADAWYFEADRQDRMPFAVLLEAALQPCGWLAAYMGSALTGDVDLSFRNLGGSAVQLAPVGREVGTLRTTATTTKVSKSGGMIIQQYDLAMTDGAGRPVYRGETTFGFFSKAALRDQVGIRDARPYEPEPAELARSRSFAYPDAAPFPDRRWGMIDRVAEMIPGGGPHGLGFVRGTMDVDPASWFFRAHFHQDPVVPGSLGLESLLQLLKAFAADRWGADPGAAFESIVVGERHRWTYRGQILPTDVRAVTTAVVTALDDDRRLIRADGFLDHRRPGDLRDERLHAPAGGPSSMKYSRVYIEAIGYELPPVVITSDEIEERLGGVYEALRIPRGQLESLTGIVERRWWDAGYPLSEGAVAAAKHALCGSSVDPKDLDVLIYAGVCRELFEPATACRVASRVGVSPEAAVFDLSNACLGVLNGMVDIANRIELGQIRAGMVVSCETSREIVDIMIEKMIKTRTMEAFKDSLATLTGGSGAVAVILTDGSVHRAEAAPAGGRGDAERPPVPLALPVGDRDAGVARPLAVPPVHGDRLDRRPQARRRARDEDLEGVPPQARAGRKTRSTR